MNQAEITPTPIEPPRILCVDDEPSILSALKRTFRPYGYQVFTANSGYEGLELLERETVDLVISDMRMPEMDGARFLQQVYERWPDAKRILLTGFADIESTVAAVNQGKIWCYVAKPWKDQELLATVAQAVEHHRLAAENLRLNQLTQCQNEELRELNASLEQKVAERTAELKQTIAFLDTAHHELKSSFLTMVQVMIGLFELQNRRLAGHARRVADTARQIARALSKDETEIQDVLMAALLHDIGKFGMEPRLIDRPFQALSPNERAEAMQHPARGESLLMAIPQLQRAAVLVRHHHECFDGSGFPDHLIGLSIPFGARILAVANDFDALQMGTLVGRPLKPADARTFIIDNRGKRYDPAVVDAFLALVVDKIPEEIQELPMRPGTTTSGMTLTRDLMHPDGYLLLGRCQTLNDAIIKQLVKIESTEGLRLTLHVKLTAGD